MPTRFRVLKTFTLLRTRGGAVIDDGAPEMRSLPVLGEYHAGQDYALTPLNRAAVEAAVKAELAVMGGE